MWPLTVSANKPEVECIADIYFVNRVNESFVRRNRNITDHLSIESQLHSYQQLPEIAFPCMQFSPLFEALQLTNDVLQGRRKMLLSGGAQIILNLIKVRLIKISRLELNTIRTCTVQLSSMCSQSCLSNTEDESYYPYLILHPQKLICRSRLTILPRVLRCSLVRKN